MLAFFRASNYHRTVDTLLTVCVSPGDKRNKSREEIEFTTSSLPATLLVLERLGFREYFRYEKFRTEYRRLGDPGVVTLDETPIGEFLEIEGPDSWIDSTARKLGFDRERYLTASYGRLFLAWCQEHGVPPGNMVFATATGDE